MRFLSEKSTVLYYKITPFLTNRRAYTRRCVNDFVNVAAFFFKTCFDGIYFDVRNSWLKWFKNMEAYFLQFGQPQFLQSQSAQDFPQPQSQSAISKFDDVIWIINIRNKSFLPALSNMLFTDSDFVRLENWNARVVMTTREFELFVFILEILATLWDFILKMIKIQSGQAWKIELFWLTLCFENKENCRFLQR